MVEFALVLPILAGFLLAIFSFGIAFERQLALTGAAREGARYGTTTPPEQTFTTGSWATNVRDLVVARSAGALSGTGPRVCVALVRGSPATTYSITTGTPRAASWFSTQPGGAPCDAAETYPVTARDNGMRVQVRVEAPVKIEAMVISRTVTVRAASTAQSESAR